MTRNWRILVTEHAQGSFNMALDETLLRAALSGRTTITVRFYGWRPRAITVGYRQDVLRDIDVEKCIRTRVSIFRRLTGGRAVLHDQEVTYSVVVPGGNSLMMGGNILDTYGRIGQALICGLKHLGVRARLHRADTTRGHNPSCFSSAGKYEILWRGKKLIGSAQRRAGDAILQHGSLLIGTAYKKLANFLRPNMSSVSSERAEDYVITLSEILSTLPSFQSVSGALRRGFEEHFEVDFTEGTLTEDERALTERLMTGRYERDDWNLRRQGPSLNECLLRGRLD